jgi:hypothetical protein
MRALLVPDTTTVFSARKTDVRNIVGSLLVKKIAQRVKLIATLPNALLPETLTGQPHGSKGTDKMH